MATQFLFRFFLRLTFWLLFIFLSHLFLLHYFDQPLFDHKIISCYTINFFLAAIIFLALYFLRKKYHDQMGFLFMFGSLIKFAAFFCFFYPVFYSDGSIDRLEFFTFFIPYLVCLITETWGVKNLLQLTSTDK